MGDIEKVVLIVGAGPGGLTLASALQVNGVPCKVFERNKKAFHKDVGAGFALSHGRLWLESISEDVKRGIKEIITPIHRFEVVEHTEEGEDKKIMGVYNMSNSPRVAKELRGPLLSGCTRSSMVNMLRSTLKPGTVELGWECKGIVQNKDGTMTVQFDVEDVDEAGVRTKKRLSETGAVVVGADGMRSKVRELMFGPKMLQMYDQAGWLLLKQDIPQSVADFTKVENQVVQLVATKKGSNIGCVGYPTSPGDFEICLAYKLPTMPHKDEEKDAGGTWENSRYGSSVEKKRAFETMKKMPGIIGKVASLADSPNDLIHISLADSSPSLGIEKWHLGRVVIIGDAPHGPTPLAGQGCNTAIGDACVLAKYLEKAFQKIGNDKERADEFITNAFEGYESERKEFGEGVCKQGNELMRSTIGNLAVPQCANTPRNSFEIALQKVLIKAIQWVLDTFPEMVADGIIKETLRGCSSLQIADEDDHKMNTIRRESSSRRSLQAQLTGRRWSSRSGL